MSNWIARVWAGAPRGVDLDLWRAAMANAEAGSHGPTVDDPFVRARLSSVRAALQCTYRGDEELRAALSSRAEADRVVEHRAAEAERVRARGRSVVADGRAAATGTDVGSRARRRRAAAAHRATRSAETLLDEARATAQDAERIADLRLREVIDRMTVMASSELAHINAYVAAFNVLVGEERLAPIGDDAVEELLRSATRSHDLA